MAFEKIYGFVKPFEKTMRFGFAVAAKKNGTKRRAEREGIECRKYNGGSKGNGKLLINLAGNTGHKADWDKNGQQHKSGGNNGAGNLLHRLDRG